MDLNDSKALDMNYESKIELLGKPRLLGRTNKWIVNKIRQLLNREALLEKILDNEEFEKEFQAWENELFTELKAIIKPFSKKDMENIEVYDIEDILKHISRRTYRRRGYTDEEITEIEDADKNVNIQQARQINALVKQGIDLDFLTPKEKNTDQDMNTGKPKNSET